MEKGNGQMKYRELISRLGRHRMNDASISYMLLLLLFAVFGCGTRSGDSGNKKDSEKPASNNSRIGEKVPAEKAASKISTSKNKEKNIGHTSVTAGGVERTRVVSHNRKEHFDVSISLSAQQSQSFHLRDMMVSPYYAELFACGRTYRKVGENGTYAAHFKVADGQQQITFDGLSLLQDEKKGGSVTAVSNEELQTKSAVAKCLLGIYRNTVVELSGKVPFSDFYLSFSF